MPERASQLKVHLGESGGDDAAALNAVESEFFGIEQHGVGFRTGIQPEFTAAFLGNLRHQMQHCFGREINEKFVGHHGQVAHRSVTANAFDGVFVQIYRIDFIAEALISAHGLIAVLISVGGRAKNCHGFHAPDSGLRRSLGKLLDRLDGWIEVGIDTMLWVWSIARPFWVIYMYAVIETGSKQYRVAAGETLVVERLDVEAGKTFTFDRVLLVSQDGQATFGAPTVPKASVVADVVNHKRGPKVIAFKMRRTEGYHRKVGHRQELTTVKIKEIKA